MIFVFHFERWNMKFIKTYLIILLAFFLVGFYFVNSEESIISVFSDDYFKSTNISIEVKSYDTEYVYNNDIESGKSKVIRDGVDGYSIVNGNVLVEPINKVVEVGTGKFDVLYGSTTGYGADCVGCSGTVSCSTINGSSHNLIRDGIYYNDSKYGDVRIIAADNSKFPCGTIMSIDNGIIDPFMAIVMDTGSAMRNAWKNGNILIDIAFKYENSDGIHDATNKSGNVKFKVYRTGW